MKIEIRVTQEFEKEAKRFLRKYLSLRDELEALFIELQNDPTYGESLGSGLRKLRLSVKSKGKGKRGGLRAITFLDIHAYHDSHGIWLVMLYDKSETGNISKVEILKVLSKYLK